MKKQLFALITVGTFYFNGFSQRQIFVNGSDLNVSTQTGTLQAISVAGSNYSPDYLSATNYLNISVTIPGSLLFSQGSRVYVNQSTASWNQALQLYIRRTGDGDPCFGCTIADNAAGEFQLVTENPRNFMMPRTNVFLLSGGGTYSNIPVQVRVSGISVTLPATTYSTMLTFTVASP